MFFSSDQANPDTYPKFYTDIQMYSNGPTQPDPELFLQKFLSTECSQKANKWQGRNITRYQQPRLRRGAPGGSQSELDPVKRAAPADPVQRHRH